MEPIVIEGLKAIFVIALPVMAVVVVASVLVGALQSAMTVSEPALGYAVRVGALVVVCYLLLPSMIETVTTLAQHAWR
jgi:flagellar biosynthesis protein FliQ